VAGAGEGDDHAIDVLGFDHLVEVAEAAQAGKVGGADQMDLFVDDADRVEAELVVLADLLDQLARDEAGAEDHGPLPQVRLPVQVGAHEGAGDDHEQDQGADRDAGRADQRVQADRGGDAVDRPRREDQGDRAARHFGDGRSPEGQVVGAVEADGEADQGVEHRGGDDVDRRVGEGDAEDDHRQCRGGDRGDHVTEKEHLRENGAAVTALNLLGSPLDRESFGIRRAMLSIYG